MRAKIGILKGDYIGPEIIAEAEKVLTCIEKKFNHQFERTYLEASGEAFDKYGKHLPEHTIIEAKKCDALLKGPFGGPPEDINHPKWSGVEQKAILPLRKHFNLYNNLRETKTIAPLIHLSPIKEKIVENVNIVIVRELTSGIYFGQKKEEIINGEKIYSDTETYSESEISRIAVKAFEIARKRRRKLTLVAKSNVLKSSLLWREVVERISKDYGDVKLDYMHVDNASMQLILNPSQFDVILTSNMFGDILSDEASVLLGSIGLLPSASLGDSTFGLYEPIHGSAPSIAGKNIANPISAILSVALMLRYSFNLENESKHIEESIFSVLEEGFRTQDLFIEGDDLSKVLGTAEFGDKVCHKIMISD
ncbi:3-isopropylmalate dehydrogenase [Paenibacillus sp. 32O-W]|uniref:3-isopropylmalate dehydrogenase n=1 Tax=Paenibacillus sp. 32O-W TaxID=1695218 RepID=UPI0011A8A625|nr:MULTISPECIES: 3-isopropylmalate dehydrogenase [Paenibacillaceae]